MPSRKRSPHPGIVILKPQPETRRPALIRWRDPVTGKFKTEKLPELAPPLLRRWLRTRAYELEGQKLKAGAAPVVKPGKSLTTAEMFNRYFSEVRLADKTVVAYKRAVERALSFPEMPTLATDLTLPILRDLRAWLHRPELAADTFNFHLRHIGTVLRHSRLAGRVPNLASDDIRDGLKTFRSGAQKKTPLSVEQLRQLVLALNRFIGEASPDVPAFAPTLFRGYVLALLLSGMRAGEARALRDLNLAHDHIWLTADMVKTRKARRVTYWESPTLPKVFNSLPRSGETNTLFGMNENQMHYLRSQVNVPFDWTFQQLRVTCGTYLTCAPSIYGGSSAYMSAARLGHSVTIAEKHYVGVVQVDPKAKTLEEAYGIADLL